MLGLDLVRHGLFCLLLSMAIWFLSVGVVFAAAAAPQYIAGALGAAFWGCILAICFGVIGKLLCLAAPKSEAQTFIWAAFACDVLPIAIAAAVSGGDLAGALGSRAIGGGSLLGSIFFVKFLEKLGERYSTRDISPITHVLTWMLVSIFLFGWVILFFLAMVAPWLIPLILLVCVGLYAYLLVTLIGGMGYYIEEVRAGRMDPTVHSIEKATEQDLTGKIKKGPTKGPEPEVPKGEPPAGAKVYRVPKKLPDLFVAVKEGDRTKVEHALAAQGDLNEKIKKDLTPLHVAASVGVMEVADLLIQRGADIDSLAAKGLTPLFVAIQTGNTNMVGLLLSRGADLFHTNEEGLTPLHWACCAPHERMAGHSRVKMVDLLLSKGADLNARDSQGRTARDIADEQQLKELTRHLERAMGIEPVSPVADILEVQEISPGDIDPESDEAYYGSIQDQKKDLAGSEICAVPGNLPPLHQAVKEGDPTKVMLQLQTGADINQTLEYALSPIHIAAIMGTMGVADLLLKKGADVDQEADFGLTPLYLAIQLNNTNMVGLLLSRGASLFHTNSQGRTPLHWCAGVDNIKLMGSPRVKMAEFLISRGADVNATDQDGLTPMQIAQWAGHEDLVTAFERWTAPQRGQHDDDDDDDDDDDY